MLLFDDSNDIYPYHLYYFSNGSVSTSPEVCVSCRGIRSYIVPWDFAQLIFWTFEEVSDVHETNNLILYSEANDENYAENRFASDCVSYSKTKCYKTTFGDPQDLSAEGTVAQVSINDEVLVPNGIGKTVYIFNNTWNTSVYHCYPNIDPPSKAPTQTGTIPTNKPTQSPIVYEVHVDPSGDIHCSSDKDICHIVCNDRQGCLGITVNCGSNNTYCILDCNGYWSCHDIILYGNRTKNLFINANNETTIARGTIVHNSRQAENLIINASYHTSFKETKIYHSADNFEFYCGPDVQFRESYNDIVHCQLVDIIGGPHNQNIYNSEKSPGRAFFKLYGSVVNMRVHHQFGTLLELVVPNFKNSIIAGNTFYPPNNGKLVVYGDTEFVINDPVNYLIPLVNFINATTYNPTNLSIFMYNGYFGDWSFYVDRLNHLEVQKGSFVSMDFHINSLAFSDSIDIIFNEFSNLFTRSNNLYLPPATPPLNLHKLSVTINVDSYFDIIGQNWVTTPYGSLALNCGGNTKYNCFHVEVSGWFNDMTVNCSNPNSCLEHSYDIGVPSHGKLDIVSYGENSLKDSKIKYDLRNEINNNINLLCYNGGCNDLEIFRTDNGIILDSNAINQHLYILCSSDEEDLTCDSLNIECPSIISGNELISTCTLDLSNLYQEFTAFAKRIVHSYSGVPYVDVICGNTSDTCTATQISCGYPYGTDTCEMAYDLNELWVCDGGCRNYLQTIEPTLNISTGSSNEFLRDQLINCTGINSNFDSCSINCLHSESCSNSTVICPIHKTAATCTIICGGGESCRDLIVYSANSKTLYISCGGQESCENMNITQLSTNSQFLTIDASSARSYQLKNSYIKTRADSISFQCSGDNSCFENNIKILRDEKSNSILFECSGSSTCYKNDIMISYDIIGEGSNNNNNSVFNMICGDSSCIEAVIDISSSNDILIDSTLQCNGVGSCEDSEYLCPPIYNTKYDTLQSKCNLIVNRIDKTKMNIKSLIGYQHRNIKINCSDITDGNGGNVESCDDITYYCGPDYNSFICDMKFDAINGWYCNGDCNGYDITNHPTMAPTFEFPVDSPTSSPTSSPTNSPTSRPSDNPSINPSISPTLNPTDSTNNPSVYPTSQPTGNPTTTPTKYPTQTPSINPTKNPSIYPTNNPSNNPSITPTLSPSRVPTSFDEYNGYFTYMINFGSDKLDTQTSNRFNTQNATFINGLTNIIELWYFESGGEFVEYYDFSVIITYMNNQIINEAGSRFNIFKNDRRRLITTSLDENIDWFSYELWCDEQNSGIFKQLFDNKNDLLLDNILIYLNDNNILSSDITISSDGSNGDEFFKIKNKSNNNSYDILLLANFFVIILSILIGTFAYFHSWFLCHFMTYCKPVDRLHSRAFFMFCIQVWDFLSDILFAREVYSWHKKKNSNISLLLVGLSALFVVVPWVMNMYNILINTANIQSHFDDNPPALRWFRRYAKTLGFLVSIAGGIFPVIQLVNSKCFGMEQFNMGLSRTEVLSFLEYKVKLNIFGENLPQLLFQIAFIYFDSSNVKNIATWIAMASSILSILSGILTYRLSKVANSNITNRYTIKLLPKENNGMFSGNNNKVLSSDLKKIEYKKLLHRRLLNHLFEYIAFPIIGTDIISISIDSMSCIILFDNVENSNNNITLIELLENNKKTLLQALVKCYDLKYANYTLDIKLSEKQWARKTQRFLAEYIKRQETTKLLSVPSSSSNDVTRGNNDMITINNSNYLIKLIKQDTAKQNGEILVNNNHKNNRNSLLVEGNNEENIVTRSHITPNGPNTVKVLELQQLQSNSDEIIQIDNPYSDEENDQIEESSSVGNLVNL